MTIIVTGGRGKTSIRLASLLHAANAPFLLASRSKSNDIPYNQAEFDWLNENTYNAPFELTKPSSPVSAIYMVAPLNVQMVPPMKVFIDFAQRKGVKRFVLLSGSAMEPGGLIMGKVHEYLISKDIEYIVLRPTWFMENFSEEEHRETITRQDKIYSATDDGKVAWISTDDIAAVAFRALTDEKVESKDHILLGPELLSYEEIAKIISDTIGRKITHVKLTGDQLKDFLESRGSSPEVATMLAGLDVAIAGGAENQWNAEVEKLTGRKPRNFRDFAEQNCAIWMKSKS